MKKIGLFSFLLPLPAFAASFFPINQTGPDFHVIESFPALGLVMVEEDGGFPNQYHYIVDERKQPSKSWNQSSYDWDPSSYGWDWSNSYHWDDDWYWSDPNGWWDWFPPWDGWWPWPPFDPVPVDPVDPIDPVDPVDPAPSDVTWGLDRINQRNLPLDGKYDLKGSTSVTAFIVDTGVQPHPELGSNLAEGYDASGGNSTADCMGHGTHVAGTVGAAKYGVAPNTQIVPVKVFEGCSGSTTTQIILRGLNWVAEHDIRPAVVNMSLGGGADQAFDDAVMALTRKGIHVVVAAGNDSTDACYGSPSRLGGSSPVITVGATDRNDNVTSFSNFGSCVNIYAPGLDIESLTPQGGLTTMSGTSMASPHVAGAVALYLATHPDATPEEGKKVIDEMGTTGVVKRYGSLTGDKLLYVEEGAEDAGPVDPVDPAD